MIARRGVSGTSVREVVRSTGTPRGSIAHHFPGGKQQLVEEAVAFAGQVIADRLERSMQESGAAEGMRRFVSFWRQHLEATGFAAGCPVLAVSLEQADGAGSGSDEADAAENARLLDVSNAVFVNWQRIVADALRQEGLSPKRARRLAALAVCALEGSVALCRAARNPGPLDDVAAEIELILSEAIRSAKRTG